MQSKASTVAEYLASLPPDRRAAIRAVREVILKNLDKDYEEGMQYGMIGYYVPHRIFPAGYHCDPTKPIGCAGLASQKNYMSLYLMCVYGSPEAERRFRGAWARTGKKLDMGRCCIRFKRVEDLALDVIGETIRAMPVRKWIDYYEKTILTMNKAAAARAAKKKQAGKSRPSARGRSSTRRAARAKP